MLVIAVHDEERQQTTDLKSVAVAAIKGAQYCADVAVRHLADVVLRAVDAGVTWDQVSEVCGSPLEATRGFFAERDVSAYIEESDLWDLVRLMDAKGLGSVSDAYVYRGFTRGNDDAVLLSLPTDLHIEDDDGHHIALIKEATIRHRLIVPGAVLTVGKPDGWGLFRVRTVEDGVATLDEIFENEYQPDEIVGWPPPGPIGNRPGVS